MTTAFIDVSGVDKTYAVGSATVSVLRGLDLQVAQGEMVAIVGASGVGKSTLLHVLGGLDTIDSGRIRIGVAVLFEMTADAVVAFRNRNVGFVFQFHHLLPEFTALENAGMPMRIARRPAAERDQRAARLLDRVGLAERLEHKPGMLSGGEQQRVAIARALANNPPLLLADEPTGNLDSATGHQVIELLIDVNRRRQTTVVLVTHDAELAALADTTIALRDGRVVANRARTAAS